MCIRDRIWGLTRPTYTAFVEDAETASIAVAENVEFIGYAWFSIATAVSYTHLDVYKRQGRARSFGGASWGLTHCW